MHSSFVKEFVLYESAVSKAGIVTPEHYTMRARVPCFAQLQHPVVDGDPL